MKKPKLISNPSAKKKKNSKFFPFNLIKKSRKKRPNSYTQAKTKFNISLLLLEALCLVISEVIACMLVLGYMANRYTGSDFFENLIPFCLGIVGLIFISAIFLLIWGKCRTWLQKLWIGLPVLFSACLVVLFSWYVYNDGYTSVFMHFRTLVGGRAAAEKNTLSHQVYATYRRYNQEDLQKIITRSALYSASIDDAAKLYQLDREILFGIAATESSFLPRESKDGGQGLFQITAVPKFLLDEVRKQLAVEKINLQDDRHNAFLAAATLKHYLSEMNNDLFLGLLAYNIGPKNGGLKFIMEQYGATDFATMQPYLQVLPRDYPIRVLSYSLAFRIWQKNGQLLSYQDSNNAIHIQRFGIPGFN